MSRWWKSKHHQLNISLKTLLNFGSTVHICIGVIFWYFLITLLDTIIHKSNHSNTSAPLMALQYFIYFFFFLPLGILLRRGVQKESVVMLEWGGGSFLLLQIYGGLTQYQYGFQISTFLSVTFPSLQLNSNLLIEIGIGLLLSIIYITILCFYVRELRSHFYLPPIYPARVDYFYYPTDTSANLTLFHKQVPVTIFHNYQNTAYFLQVDSPGPGSIPPNSRSASRRGHQGTTGSGTWNTVTHKAQPTTRKYKTNHSR